MPSLKEAFGLILLALGLYAAFSIIENANWVRGLPPLIIPILAALSPGQLRRRQEPPNRLSPGVSRRSRRHPRSRSPLPGRGCPYCLWPLLPGHRLVRHPPNPPAGQLRQAHTHTLAGPAAHHRSPRFSGRRLLLPPSPIRHRSRPRRGFLPPSKAVWLGTKNAPAGSPGCRISPLTGGGCLQLAYAHPQRSCPTRRRFDAGRANLRTLGVRSGPLQEHPPAERAGSSSTSNLHYPSSAQWNRGRASSCASPRRRPIDGG